MASPRGIQSIEVGGRLLQALAGRGQPMALKDLGQKHCTSVLAELCGLAADLQKRMEALRKILAHDGNGDVAAHARYCREKIVPAMDAVRAVVDQLEFIVADDLWPLPTYQEMLFIK